MLGLGPYITPREGQCHHCGEPMPETDEWRKMVKLFTDIRVEYGQPLRITSSYRCKDHPIEARKDKPGQHSIAALDISTYQKDAVRLLRIIMARPAIRGIGIRAVGPADQRFIHIDLRKSPVLWSYPA